MRKEPKGFLRDWSGIDDPGARAERLVACQRRVFAEPWAVLGLTLERLAEIDVTGVKGGVRWVVEE